METESSGPLAVVDYDPQWPLQFRHEADKIQTALGERALQIEHAGSTSVPGLAAKPIVDVILLVADSSAEQDYSGDLESVGYRLCIREPEWHEHRMFKGHADRVNLHVFSRGCTEACRMLAFRDRLRTDPDDRELYAQCKRALARRQWKDTQEYADAKTQIVAEILARARAAQIPDAPKS